MLKSISEVSAKPTILVLFGALPSVLLLLLARSLAEDALTLALCLAPLAAIPLAIAFLSLPRKNQAPLSLSSGTLPPAEDSLLGRVSHELRTPLNAIVGLSEVLREDPSLSHATAQDIQKINQAAWQLVQLVDDLLELSTLPLSPIALHETHFDAERFVSMINRMGEVLASPYLTRFKVHCPSNFGPIYADENRLLQVCMNLVRNALRYTRDGRIDLHLYPTWEQNEARIQIDIRDSGKGMTPAELAHLHEICAVNAGDEDLGRLNLLLPTTRRICDLMGARLQIESRSGLGTTCSVSFVDRMSEKRQLQRSDLMQRPRALLIDSGIRGNEEIVRLLSHQGVEVCRVQKASSGLRVFFEMAPDFVLADGRDWTDEKVGMIESIRYRDPQCPIFFLHDSDRTETESLRVTKEIEQLCRKPRVLKGR